VSSIGTLTSPRPRYTSAGYRTTKTPCRDEKNAPLAWPDEAQMATLGRRTDVIPDVAPFKDVVVPAECHDERARAAEQADQQGQCEMQLP
jgi:hypothetical protein